MGKFEFEDTVKLVFDRVAGTKGYTCQVNASNSTAAVKGLGLLVEEVICRLAVILLYKGEGDGHGAEKRNAD